MVHFVESLGKSISSIPLLLIALLKKSKKIWQTGSFPESIFYVASNGYHLPFTFIKLQAWPTTLSFFRLSDNVYPLAYIT